MTVKEPLEFFLLESGLASDDRLMFSSASYVTQKARPYSSAALSSYVNFVVIGRGGTYEL